MSVLPLDPEMALPRHHLGVFHILQPHPPWWICILLWFNNTGMLAQQPLWDRSSLSARFATKERHEGLSGNPPTDRFRRCYPCQYWGMVGEASPVADIATP